MTPERRAEIEALADRLDGFQRDQRPNDNIRAADSLRELLAALDAEHAGLMDALLMAADLQRERNAAKAVLDSYTGSREGTEQVLAAHRARIEDDQ